jgi:hypothetical protein
MDGLNSVVNNEKVKWSSGLFARKRRAIVALDFAIALRLSGVVLNFAKRCPDFQLLLSAISIFNFQILFLLKPL